MPLRQPLCAAGEETLSQILNTLRKVIPEFAEEEVSLARTVNIESLRLEIKKLCLEHEMAGKELRRRMESMPLLELFEGTEHFRRANLTPNPYSLRLPKH